MVVCPLWVLTARLREMLPAGTERFSGTGAAIVVIVNKALLCWSEKKMTQRMFHLGSLGC